MSSGRARDLLFVGRPVPEKGLPDLLVALQHVPACLWQLSIVGDLPASVSMPSGKNVSYLGRIAHAEIAGLMQRHDILIVPSRYETFGNVALEGLAVAMIVVAARTGGLKELITNGCNGFHFTPGDVDDLALTLRSVLTSDRLLPIRANARASATRYSWDSVTAATARLLESVL